MLIAINRIPTVRRFVNGESPDKGFFGIKVEMRKSELCRMLIFEKT